MNRGELRTKLRMIHSGKSTSGWDDQGVNDG